MNPLISVIIPARNSEKTIETAINSILGQTYPNLEIIIVNDNSADDTETIAKNFTEKYRNVKYYSLSHDDPERFNKSGKNINAGYLARNYGFKKTNGEWITFQDSDDASLKNRIEAQYNLAIKYGAMHLCIDWQQYKEGLFSKRLDVDRIFKEQKDVLIGKSEILKLVRKTKGLFVVFKKLNTKVPFEIRRKRVLNKLFFGSFDPYPGAGNSPLFKREIIEKVKFRKLEERIWPSYVGRGADRDFNFQIAEIFKNSLVFKLPLYLWRVKGQNFNYEDYKKYLKN